jgi:hypothetical protein
MFRRNGLQKRKEEEKSKDENGGRRWHDCDELRLLLLGSVQLFRFLVLYLFLRFSSDM